MKSEEPEPEPAEGRGEKADIEKNEEYYDFEVQKIIIDYFSSQLVAHASHLLATAAISVGVFITLLEFREFPLIMQFLLILFSFFFSVSLYALGRWLFFSKITIYSMGRELVDLIEKEKRDHKDLEIKRLIAHISHQIKNLFALERAERYERELQGNNVSQDGEEKSGKEKLKNKVCAWIKKVEKKVVTRIAILWLWFVERFRLKRVFWVIVTVWTCLEVIFNLKLILVIFDNLSKKSFFLCLTEFGTVSLSVKINFILFISSFIIFPVSFIGILHYSRHFLTEIIEEQKLEFSDLPSRKSPNLKTGYHVLRFTQRRR